jgi:putative ABC transport system substrate-binding protein
MTRRAVLAALCTLLIWPAAAPAQQPHRVPIVGLLITHAPLNDPVFDSLRAGLHEFGYEDGRNIKLEARSALGQLDRVPSLAEELVRLPADVILVVNEIALRAARQATSAIPIVMVGYYREDPVAAGWIESYSHPGGNVTGIFSLDSVLIEKRMEILKEALPKMSRVAILWDSAFVSSVLDPAQAAAKRLGLQPIAIEYRSVEDLEVAFKSAKRKKATAVFLAGSPMLYIYRDRVAVLALNAGLPTITELDPVAKAGILLSYGSRNSDNWVHAAYFIDRLLKGAKAADLPVEQVSKLTLVVNLKTAKALGITIPESILLRADEVIR